MVADGEGQDKDGQSFKARQFSRDSVKIISDIREHGGGRHKVSVLDLSRSGFRMQSATFIPADRVIYLTIPGYHPLESRIAWNEKEFYGCEFVNKLHVAIYDHLITRYPSLGPRH